VLTRLIDGDMSDSVQCTMYRLLLYFALHVHHVSKKTAFLFLSELHQISTNCNKFW